MRATLNRQTREVAWSLMEGELQDGELLRPGGYRGRLRFKSAPSPSGKEVWLTGTQETRSLVNLRGRMALKNRRFWRGFDRAGGQELGNAVNHAQVVVEYGVMAKKVAKNVEMAVNLDSMFKVWGSGLEGLGREIWAGRLPLDARGQEGGLKSCTSSSHKSEISADGNAFLRRRGDLVGISAAILGTIFKTISLV